MTCPDPQHSSGDVKLRWDAKKLDSVDLWVRHELMDALSKRNCSASSALSFALLKACLSKLSSPGETRANQGLSQPGLCYEAYCILDGSAGPEPRRPAQSKGETEGIGSKEGWARRIWADFLSFPISCGHKSYLFSHWSIWIGITVVGVPIYPLIPDSFLSLWRDKEIQEFAHNLSHIHSKESYLNDIEMPGIAVNWFIFNPFLASLAALPLMLRLWPWGLIVVVSDSSFWICHGQKMSNAKWHHWHCPLLSQGKHQPPRPPPKRQAPCNCNCQEGPLQFEYK